MLSQKFNLFSGVFGSSDEVIGSIESGVDFEKRISEIYQKCKTSEEIQAEFDSLQEELADQINEKMVQARQSILENFDEDDIEVVKSPSALLRIKAPSGNTYAVTFSHSFFLADKYADREFAFNFARRLEFDVIRTTALTSPNSQRNRTVNSYIDYNLAGTQ